jgi:hypothetical protein
MRKASDRHPRTFGNDRNCDRQLVSNVQPGSASVREVIEALFAVLPIGDPGVDRRFK